MNFDLFTKLFERIDQATATFVTDISSNTVAAITPIVTAALTLGFIAYGLLIIRGAVEMPVMEFIGRSIRIGIIVSIALTSGLYQQEIAGLIQSVPDDLATTLIQDPTTADDAASMIDQAAGRGFDRASEAFENAGFFSSEGWTYALLGIIILLSTGILTAIGGAFMILAKVALALLAGLGPLFILALLFQPTARFFELWLGQVVNYGLLIVLLAAMFGLMMSIYSGYVNNIDFDVDGQQNVAGTVGGCFILAVAALVILLQLPSIASGLASGVGLSYLWELRSIRRGIGSRALRNTDGSLRSRGSGAIGAAQTAGRAGRAGVSAASRGAKAAVGYFRGRRAA